MRVRDVALFFVAMLVVVTTWAVGVPRFASPDEPGHIYKAYATAHGELLGRPAAGEPDNLREFDGPAALGTPDLNCFNGRPEVPAACAGFGVPPLVSSAARYPPWYYGLVGVPVAVAGQSERVLAFRLVSAAMLTRYIGSQLYGVRTFDPSTMAGVVGVLAIAALAGCWVPARRAGRIDPLTALRAD